MSITAPVPTPAAAARTSVLDACAAGAPSRRRRRPAQPRPRPRLRRRRRRPGRRGGHLEPRDPAHPRRRRRRHLRGRRRRRRPLGRAHGLPVAVQATGHGAGPQRRRLRCSSPPAGCRACTSTRTGGSPASRPASSGSRSMEAAAEYGLAPLCGSSSDVGVVGLHPRRRHGPARAQARLRRRPRARRRDRHRRRPAAPGLRRDRARAVLGRPRRQGQLRHRHRAGVRAGAGAPAVRRRHLLRRRRRRRAAARASASGRRRCPRRSPPRSRSCGCPTDGGAAAAAARADRRPPAVRLRRRRPAEAERLLAPMQAAGTILLGYVGPMPDRPRWTRIHMDPMDPMPAWEKGMLLRELTAEAVDALLADGRPAARRPADHGRAAADGRGAGPAGRRCPTRSPGRDGACSLLVLGPAVPELAEIVPAIGRGVLARAGSPWAARRVG